jgi:hypothetical protein
MAFEVEVERTFRARQGLPSPVRARRGLSLPTFELVARHVFTELAAVVPQLVWVELADRSFGSRTRYRGR